MADAYLEMDVKQVEQHVDWLISEYPELAEDEALRADMVEGEMDLESLLGRILSHYAEADMMVEAIKLRASDLSSRRARYESRMKAFRALAKRVLMASGKQSMTLAEATISISKPRERAIVSDVSQLPQGFVTIEPKLAEILKSLKAGEAVPGAALQLGDAGLSIRTK